MSRDWTPEELQAASAAMKEAGEMSYEEFSAEVEAANEAKSMIDAFATIQKDGINFCPRCGKMTVKDRLHTNALSRHADIYVCDACGNDEALRDWKNEPLPLKDWAINNYHHTLNAILKLSKEAPTGSETPLSGVATAGT